MSCKEIVNSILNLSYKVEVYQSGLNSDIQHVIVVYPNKNNLIMWRYVYYSSPAFAVNLAKEIVNVDLSKYKDLFQKTIRINGSLIWSSLDDV